MQLDWSIILILLFVLACPVSMWLMMRGHRRHGSGPEPPGRGDAGPTTRDE